MLTKANGYLKKIYKKSTKKVVLDFLINIRKNIETYLITRYNMNLSFAQQITSILEKTSLDDKDLRSGMNDSVIELAIKQMTEKRTSSLNDAQHIRKQETAENVISSNSSNQTEDQDSAKKQEFEEMRRKYIEDMEKYQAESEELRAKITSRRGRR